MSYAKPQARKTLHLSTKSILIIFIITIHCAFLLVLLVTGPIPIKQKKEKIRIRTLQPQQKMQPLKAKETTPHTNATKGRAQPPIIPKAPIKKEPPQQQQASTPAKQARAKPTVKKEPNQNPPTKQSLSPQATVPDNLLKELESKIAKLSHPKQTTAKEKPLEIPVLPQPTSLADQISSEEAEFEATEDFMETLISFLHTHLNLPDYGEVKMQITIGKTGVIEKAIAISSESLRNKKYLEDTLPGLRLAGCFIEKKIKTEQTFTFTFCNKL